MPSTTLRVIAACVFVVILLPAVAFPPGFSPPDKVSLSVVRAIGGGIMLVSGFGLAASLEKTLLRAGGNNAFKMLYVSAAGFSGVGAAQCLAAVYQINLFVPIILCSVLSIVTCILWLRFYNAAAG